MNANHTRIEGSKIIVHIPLKIHTWGGKRVIVGPQGQDLRVLEAEIRKDEKLLKALGRSYLWHTWLMRGKYKTVQEMAERQKINKSYMLRMMRIMTLSPKIIEAILDGKQPEGFALTDIEKAFPPIWAEQEEKFGFKNLNKPSSNNKRQVTEVRAGSRDENQHC